MNYKDISEERKQSLPETFGHPYNDPYVLTAANKLWVHGNQYDLTFDEVMEELQIALDIGLENYGSGKASWMVPTILKGNCDEFKPFNLLGLYIEEVCGDYSWEEIKDFWEALSKPERCTLSTILEEHLNDRLQYALENFSI